MHFNHSSFARERIMLDGVTLHVNIKYDVYKEKRKVIVRPILVIFRLTGKRPFLPRWVDEI